MGKEQHCKPVSKHPLKERYASLTRLWMHQCPSPVHILFLHICLCKQTCALGVVILHESVSLRELLSQEGYQEVFQYIDIHWCIHNLVKDAYLSLSGCFDTGLQCCSFPILPH